VLAVKLADPLALDDLDREMAVSDSGGRQRRGDRVAQVAGHVGEVDGQGVCSS
jgi:hypothetical protein